MNGLKDVLGNVEGMSVSVSHNYDYVEVVTDYLRHEIHVSGSRTISFTRVRINELSNPRAIACRSGDPGFPGLDQFTITAGKCGLGHCPCQVMFTFGPMSDPPSSGTASESWTYNHDSDRNSSTSGPLLVGITPPTFIVCEGQRQLMLQSMNLAGEGSVGEYGPGLCLQDNGHANCTAALEVNQAAVLQDPVTNTADPRRRQHDVTLRLSPSTDWFEGRLRLEVASQIDSSTGEDITYPAYAISFHFNGPMIGNDSFFDAQFYWEFLGQVPIYNEDGEITGSEEAIVEPGNAPAVFLHGSDAIRLQFPLCLTPDITMAEPNEETGENLVWSVDWGYTEMYDPVTEHNRAFFDVSGDPDPEAAEGEGAPQGFYFNVQSGIPDPCHGNYNFNFTESGNDDNTPNEDGYISWSYVSSASGGLS